MSMTAYLIIHPHSTAYLALTLLYNGPVELLCISHPVSLSFPSCKSRRSNGDYKGCMATVSIFHQPTPRWCLNDLSTELLELIFRNLQDIDGRSLAASRLLSSRFNAIVTPIKYETLHLTERILDARAEVHHPRGLEHVYTHTRHVEARSDLNAQRIKRVLDRIQRLLSVSWRYVRADFRSAGVWMPADILSRRHIEINRTKLYVDNLPLRDFDGELYDTYLRAIPTDALTSLKMASPTPPLTTRLDSLKRLLTEASRLETFHYDDRGQGTRFTFTGNERLPAFKELNLRSYDWNHGSDVVLKHWDFSQIQHLKLVDVPMFPFLTSIAFPDLRQLRTLHCEDFSAHLPEKREEATRGLDLLVRQIWALNTLKLTCHTRLFPVVDTLLRHAGSLRMLRLRDHVGFGDEERRCPTLRASDLARLAAHGGGLVHLRALELDMDVALCDDPPLFLRALCAFPRLHSLVLHTQTVLRPLEEEVAPLGTDRDYDAAMGIFAALARGRQSAGAVTWRSVTVNVGGWRHVMVRRMGEAWREQNARGVFAERCFVMERGEGGGMVVREEMAVET